MGILQDRKICERCGTSFAKRSVISEPPSRPCASSTALQHLNGTSRVCNPGISTPLHGFRSGVMLPEEKAASFKPLFESVSDHVCQVSRMFIVRLLSPGHAQEHFFQSSSLWNLFKKNKINQQTFVKFEILTSMTSLK